jgi:phage repressor protein C with HTH and peptisase S24 domain
MFDNRCDNKNRNSFSFCQQIDKKSFQNDNFLIEINKMPTEDYKKRTTQEFIKNVETVIGKGLARNHAEIIDLLDWDAGAFSNVMNGRRNAPPDKADKLKELFNLSTSYQEQRRNHKLNNVKDEDITVYQIGTKASFIDIYDDQKDEPIGKLNSSVFPGCNHAEKVSGSSMYPMIFNQAMVVGEKIEDAKGISSGEIYVIHTKRGLRTCKYVHTIEKKPDEIKLVALNKNVPPQNIPVADITLIMRVYFIINPS